VSESLRKIRDILTLRYHPANSPLPKLDWTDFVECQGISQVVPSSLEVAITKLITVFNPRCVGMGISGGVDSTTILCLLRKVFPDLEINTYCVTFGEDVKESENAERVAERFSTNHKHVHIDNPFEELERQIAIVDEPRWNLYPYFLFKEASGDCDLLLTGDGGDELFGGYVFRYDYFLHSETQPLVKRYLEAHNRDWVPDQEDMFAFPFDWNDIYKLLEPYFNNPLPLLGKVFLADYNGKLLYDFAHTTQSFSAFFNIRAVAPMLEREVLHVATHIPYNLKYDERSGVGKLVLRQILVENKCYDLVSNSKIGWGMNLIEMWDKYVKHKCEEMLNCPRIVEQGIISRNWLPRGFQKANEHDIRYICKMLGLLALEIWLKVKGL
jgi:asparagine synthase (glutamine-hydrolysing)